MRLRPTAVGSTLRETARPRRGGAPSRSQCRLSSGALVRLAPSNTRAKSALARIRAARGRVFREGIGRRLRPARSGAEALAALGTTTGQDLAAVGGRHAGTETVVALALEVAGLVGALGGHGWILYRVTDGKDSESYGIRGITVNGRVSSIGGWVGGAPAVRQAHPVHHVAFERSPSPPPGRPEVVSLFPPKPAATQGPAKGPRGRSAPHGACGMRSAPPRDSSVATPSSRSPPVVPCCIPFARSVLPANAGRAFVGSAPHTVSMDAWPRCLERLEAEFPAEDVHTWLKPLQASLRDDAFVLYAPNAFVMEEVRSRYLDRIRELLSHFAGSDQVSLEIGSLRKKPAPAPASVPPARPAATAETFQGHLDSHYTF